MKRTILAFGLFFTASLLTASTQVPSSITTDTQWDASGSPYLIQGKTVVAKGATLRIGPNVKVVLKGNSALEVDGTLNAEGSAAAPVAFDLTEGGLQSEIFLNGAEALLTNLRVTGGVFLVQDAQLHLQWFELTKGSGLYLRGNTSASVKNGKIYGNATGVVLDGPVQVGFEFNTLTQNTYGVFLKNFSNLDFSNNSVHDNDKDVVSLGSSAPLGGNYWGNMDEKTVRAKVQGQATLAPLKSLKDILRVYVRTQLPLITQPMETALKAKERKAREAVDLAEKKAKEEEKRELAAQKAADRKAAREAKRAAAEQKKAAAKSPEATTPAATEAPAEAAAPEEATAPVPTPEIVENEVETAPEGVVTVKELPAAPHRLKARTDLPPNLGDITEAAPTAPSAAEGSTVPEAPAAAAPEAVAPVPAAPEPAPAAPAVPEAAAPAPAVPASPEMAPPPAPAVETGNTTASTGALPPPPAIDMTAPPDLGNTPVPAADNTAPAPPPVPSSASAPPPPPVPASTVDSGAPAPAVPAPPALNDQVTPAPAASNPPPAPPPAPVPAAAAPTPAVSAEDQQKALQSLDGVSGDIDGMQAPPLDLNMDLNAPSGNSSNSSAPSSTGLTLPPLKDSAVAPPKDLDLPPTDDLGSLDQKK